MTGAGADGRIAPVKGSEMVDLEGKTAMITGAGQGIGRDIALMLAAAGADIAALDVNLEGAEATAALVRTKGREEPRARLRRRRTRRMSTGASPRRSRGASRYISSLTTPG